MERSNHYKEILKVIGVIVLVKIIFFVLAGFLFIPSEKFEYIHKYNFSYPKEE